MAVQRPRRSFNGTAHETLLLKISKRKHVSGVPAAVSRLRVEQLEIFSAGSWRHA